MIMIIIIICCVRHSDIQFNYNEMNNNDRDYTDFNCRYLYKKIVEILINLKNYIILYNHFIYI